jgi:uncharacterized protein (DUF58 family)
LSAAMATMIAGGLGIIGGVVGAALTYYFGLRKSRFERLEERRAEVLAELSGLLFEVENKYRKWYLPSLRPSPGHTMEEIRGKVAERAGATVESLNTLTRCYYHNVAWLDPDVAARVEGCITELQEMLFEYGRVGPANTRFQVSE